MEWGEQGDRYVVTGAAGHLGGTIVRSLLNAGREVRGLILPGEAGSAVGPGISYFSGDVREAKSLEGLFEGWEGAGVTVIHTAALISIARKVPQALYEVNVGGTRNILRLCREHGARRLVHVSSVHAIPELPQGQVMREVDAFSPETVFGGYARTKAEAAQAVLDAAREGLNAVIVLPSGIIGPYDRGRNHLVQLFAGYLDGSLPACVEGGYDFVDVRDVARGCLLAAERGRSGESYLLGGHYARIPELLAMAGKVSGKGDLPVMPLWLARAAVPAIGGWAALRGRRPLYTGYSLRTLTGNGLFSSEKARRELGYAPRELEETVRDMVMWLQRAE